MTKAREFRFFQSGVFSLLLVMILFVSAKSQSPSPYDSIFAENAFGNSGDTVDVSILMVNSLGVGGFTLRLLYDDSILKPVSALLTGRDSGFFEEPIIDTTQSGVMRLVCISENPWTHSIPAGRGSVLIIRFCINSNVIPGATLLHFEDRGPQTFDNAMSDSSGRVLIIPNMIDGYVQITPLLISSDLEPKVFSNFLNNSPNPFNNNTTINMNITVSANVDIIIFDILGRKIKTLNLGFINGGQYRINWDGRDDVGKEVSSGIYCYALFVENRCILNNRMVFLK